MAEIEEEEKQTKSVRERTFKVRLSETEYQLLDTNNPYGSIAKLLRQSAVEKTTRLHGSNGVLEHDRSRISTTELTQNFADIAESLRAIAERKLECQREVEQPRPKEDRGMDFGM